MQYHMCITQIINRSKRILFSIINKNSFYSIMDKPIVTVKQGKLQGIFEENVLGSRYIAFKGIPFAAPPVGKLRFKDPEPPAAWAGVRDASRNAGSECIQLTSLPNPTLIGSEDCLYLNVFIPENIYGTKRNPVMVWVHGGGYFVGSGNDTDKRPDYLLAKGVILVSINYRLGALGFLNLDHEIASGNQGLKDQAAALKWIKENIETFGGDSNNITVFGISAGSSSTHLLMLSPLSKGLFHKAILQSGIATCNWAVLKNKPEDNGFRLASLLGNDSKDPEKVVEFLQTVPASEIVATQYKIFDLEQRIINIPFRPTIDEKAKTPFLPRPISQLLHDDNDIPIMLGSTSYEYIMFLKDTSENTLKTQYEDLPRKIQTLTDSEDPQKIMQLTERAKQWYLNNKPFTEENIPSLLRLLSDIYFDIAIKTFTDKRRKRKQAPAYLYKFSYIGNEMTTTRLNGNKLALCGASHTDELSYLFYIPKCKVNDPKPPAVNSKDRKILEILTTMWSNFAKTGNPTPAFDQHINTIWPPATADAFNCLDIGDTLQVLTVTDYDYILRDSTL
ncbi:esterase E4 [Linepithema humile]|uniref:esterase E4 n=1 Tax=Linepithema humile TaxID=83485 RepID=UPI0006231E10|nr:PREDICTED: esterase E4-like [Linepithema humile]